MIHFWTAGITRKRPVYGAGRHSGWCRSPVRPDHRPLRCWCHRRSSRTASAWRCTTFTRRRRRRPPPRPWWNRQLRPEAQSCRMTRLPPSSPTAHRFTNAWRALRPRPQPKGKHERMKRGKNNKKIRRWINLSLRNVYVPCVTLWLLS